MNQEVENVDNYKAMKNKKMKKNKSEDLENLRLKNQEEDDFETRTDGETKGYSVGMPTITMSQYPDMGEEETEEPEIG